MRKGPVAVCIIVENLPVPPDRRVWQEARALTEAGYHVSIICPKGRGFQRSRETLHGIEIYRHGNWEASGALGYLVEYSWALISEFVLALRIYARTHFRVLQACNPPDTVFLIGLFFKLLGVRFVFDHHDPAPELYEARFHRKGLLHWLLRLAERLTFLTAEVTIATNDSLKEIALGRGGFSPVRSFVVRGCPDLSDLRPQVPRPELKEGRRYLVVYVGVMGPQDGVDLLLESIEYLVKEKGRRDSLFVLIGPGTELPRLKARAAERDLDVFVKFTGALYGDDLLAYLATADVGVAPDPYNELNNKLTMIKIFEYMAYGLPVVLYDLIEGRRSAGDAAVYPRKNDTIDFGDQIATLLDSPSLRRRLGAMGRTRVVDSLNWDFQKQTFLEAYRTACCARIGKRKAEGFESASPLEPHSK
jgi:glycosyltransferase involved in cell wall biosynthesis